MLYMIKIRDLRFIRRVSTFMAALTALCLWLPVHADPSGAFPVAPEQDVIGKSTVSFPMDKDTLLDVARDYDLGYNEIVAANPDVDPWLPEAGKPVTVPTEWLIPDAVRDGIVLNLAEMRLYYFFSGKGTKMVVTYPIGVGKEGFDTPTGEFRVTGREKNPVWHPTSASKSERPELPRSVPPGPDNPLGGYKITMSIPGEYLLHSTNRPWGVGRRVSHGCMRLYPEDMTWLFDMAKVGTKVKIVYQPVKAGLVDGRLFVEIHEDYIGNLDLAELAVSAIYKKGLERLLDSEKLYKALSEKSGLPTDVTLDTPE